MQAIFRLYCNCSHCCASGNRIYDKCTKIDGGTFANNPSIITIAAILRGNPSLKLSDIILISRGTGKMDIIDSKKIHNSGMIGWIKDANIIDLILNATEDISEWCTNSLGIKTYRIQIALDPGKGRMDDCSNENIQTLITKTQDYIKTHIAQIDEICNLLLQNAEQ